MWCECGERKRVCERACKCFPSSYLRTEWIMNTIFRLFRFYLFHFFSFLFFPFFFLRIDICLCFHLFFVLFWRFGRIRRNSCVCVCLLSHQTKRQRGKNVINEITFDQFFVVYRVGLTHNITFVMRHFFRCFVIRLSLWQNFFSLHSSFLFLFIFVSSVLRVFFCSV